MDFVKNDAAPAQTVEETLRIKQHPAYARTLTVEVFDVRQTLAEASLPNTPDARKPHDRPRTPGVFNEIQPEMTVHHTQVYLHMVSLNASTLTFGGSPAA